MSCVASTVNNAIEFLPTSQLMFDVHRKIVSSLRLPSKLSDKDKHQSLRLSPDRLTADFSSSRLTSSSSSSSGFDVSIQANFPFHPYTRIGYFEITVEQISFQGMVSIGLAEKNYPNNKQPGWKSMSYGYHGDDGRKFHNSGAGVQFGPKFTTGDTVGCGLIFSTHELFFTKNGKLIDKAWNDVRTDDGVQWFPTIGFDRAKITVNFGNTTAASSTSWCESFKFDKLASMIEEEHAAERLRIESVPSAGVDSIRNLIRSYLVHSGCIQTLSCLDGRDYDDSHPTGSVSAPDTDATTIADADGDIAMKPASKQANRNGDPLLFEISLRKRIRDQILAGQVAKSIELLQQRCPQFLISNSYASTLLRCQHFIELIASHHKPAKQHQNNAGGEELLEAINFTQEMLGSLMEGEHAALVQEVVGLLAYERPFESPLAYLLTSEQREKVADQICRCLLEFLGARPTSNIESLLRQMAAAYQSLYVPFDENSASESVSD